MKPIDLAVMFHDHYEKLAPSFGYETRLETKVFDPESNNGRLMIAVCELILKGLLPAAKVRALVNAAAELVGAGQSHIESTQFCVIYERAAKVRAALAALESDNE